MLDDATLPWTSKINKKILRTNWTTVYTNIVIYYTCVSEDPPPGCWVPKVESVDAYIELSGFAATNTIGTAVTPVCMVSWVRFILVKPLLISTIMMNVEQIPWVRLITNYPWRLSDVETRTIICGIESITMYKAFIPLRPSPGAIWNKTNSIILLTPMTSPDSIMRRRTLLYGVLNERLATLRDVYLFGNPSTERGQLIKPNSLTKSFPQWELLIWRLLSLTLPTSQQPSGLIRGLRR